MWYRCFYLLVVNIFCVGLVQAQVNADFVVDKTESCGPSQFNFFDQSTSTAGPILSWKWDLSVASSSKQNPGVIFNQPGVYTICLTATDSQGNSDTTCKDDYINIYDFPTADFTVNQTEGCVPLQVVFSDQSTSPNGSIVDWTWSVGGSRGVVQNKGQDFSSIYNQEGFFSASLIVIDEKGCQNNVNFANLIKANEIVLPTINKDILQNCSFPWELDFSISDIDSEVDYFWDFGNGQSSNSPNPGIVNYTSAGTFDVVLYLEKPGCRDSIVLEQFVSTFIAGEISVDQENECIGSPITFNAIGVEDADSLLWNFGDGTVSIEPSPMHDYDVEGCYDVSLTAFLNGCNESVTYSCVNVNPNPQLSVEVLNPSGCLLPHEIILAASAQELGSYTWSFNGSNYDGDTVYISVDEFGEYPVELLFESTSGCILNQIVDTVSVLDFEILLPEIGPSGCSPLVLNFSDSINSGVAITDYEWTIFTTPSFISNDPILSHTISDTGVYDLQLLVENELGCRDTLYKENYIGVGIPPEVAFSVDPYEQCADERYFYYDEGDSFTNGWFWEFGDGDTSLVQNPTHFYEDTGYFQVLLSSFHNGCPSIGMEEYVYVKGSVSVIEKVHNCTDPYTVQLINNSINADSFYWTIEYAPGLIDTFRQDTFDYTFADRGDYPISLYTQNFVDDCDFLRRDTVRIKDPVALYTIDTLRGCVPFDLSLTDQSIDAELYFYQNGPYTYDIDTIPSPTISIPLGGILASPTLIIEDIHECRDTFTLPDSIYANQLTLDPIYPQAVCVPDTVYLSDASISLLSSINEYYWEIENQFMSTASDTFFVLTDEGSFDLLFDVKDEFGCEQTLSLENAIIGDQTIIDFTLDTLSCTSKAVRFRDITQADDIVSRLWDFGDGNSSNAKDINHNYQTEGSYDVCLTVENAIGCTKTLCKEKIVNIRNPEATFTGDSLFASCPPLLVNFDNLSTNGQNFSWDFGDNSGKSSSENISHVFTEPGSYDITLVTEMIDGCIDTLVKEDYIVIQGPVADFKMDAEVGCKPLNIELFGSSNEPYTFIWDYGDGTIDSIPNLIDQHTTQYLYNEIGVFSPRLIVVDASGCARSFSGEEIEIVEVISSFALVDSIVCGTETDIELINTSSSSRPIESYSWAVNGPEMMTSNASDPAFDISSLGEYDIQLISQIGSCIDTFEAKGVVEVAAIPTADFSFDTDLLCEYVGVDFKDLSTISAGSIPEYSWDFGDDTVVDTMQNPTHFYEETGDFNIELTVTSDLGCKDSTSQSLSIDDNVFIEIDEDKTICIGDETTISVDFNDAGVTDFYWLTDPSLSCTNCMTAMATPSDTTIYYFQSFYENGCESLDSVTVNVVPVPSPIIDIVYDSLVCRDVAFMISIANFDNTLTYNWSQDGEQINSCNADCESITVEIDNNTNFVISVLNEFGCGNTEDISIKVEENPDPIVSERSLCLGDTITLMSRAGNNPTWKYDSDLSCISCPDPQVSPQEETIYYLEINSDIACVFHDTVTVTPYDLNIDAGNDYLICTGEAINITATGAGDPTWYDSNGFVIGNDFIVNVSPFESQHLYLESVQGDCLEKDSLYVEIIEKATVSTLGDTLCPGDLFTLNAEGIFDKFTWLRSRDQSTLAVNEHPSIAPRTTQSYEIIASYRSCTNDTAIAIIEVLPEILIELETDINYYPNVPIQFEVMYDIAKGYFFDWMPGELLSCTDCPDPEVISFLRTQNFDLNVFDPATGCELDTTVLLRYNRDCSPEAFYVPNIFSPNGDKINDGFRAFAQVPEDFVSLTIFNRWGEKMFYSENLESEWDGVFKGEETLIDSYTYLLVAKCEGETVSFPGTVTLVR